MFSALLNAPCELRLHLLQSVIFIYPPHREETDNLESPPNQTDSLVRGLVELYVPSPRHISGIKVKLRALQTVAVLDANSGQIPVSWEDSVLLEKEVRIGAQGDADKKYAGRGRTPVPASSRLRNPSNQPAAQSSSPGPSSDRRPSQRPSLESGAQDSPEDVSLVEEEEDDERTGRSTSVAAVFARAVSRGRNGSKSRNNSRNNSRATSPVASRATSPTRRLDSFASTSNSAAARNASVAPALLPPSPPATPRDDSPHGDRLNSTVEAFNDARGRPAASRSTSEARLSDRLAGSLSIGRDVERVRAAEHSQGGWGHPNNDDFGLRQPKPPSNIASGLGTPSGPAVAGGQRGRGGLAKRREGSRGPGGSVPPRGLVDDSASTRSSSLGGWARFGRSVSRARGIGAREASVSRAPRDSQAEDAEGMEATVDVGAGGGGGLVLEKGVHGFEFAFIIPANSAEYTRSPFGRVRYVVKATAYGAGRAKSNVEGWRDCFPVANPSMEGGPTPLTVLYNDVHPTVGVMSIACTSQNISVGGLFQLDIHSPIPPKDLIVYLVRISIDTTIELRTKRKGRQVVPAQRQKLFEKGYVPPRKEDQYSSGDGKKEDGQIRDPKVHGEDSAWTVQGLARMPDDNTIRSSTIGGTRADIRFSHQLVVEVVHSRESEDPSQPRKLKVFALRQPITLPSCCVAFDAASLPAYTPAAENTDARPTIDGLPYDLAHMPDGSAAHNNHSTGAQPANGASAGPSSAPRSNTAGPRGGAEHDHCVCGLSLQDLETRERAMIPVGANHDIPIESIRSHGKIGEILPRRSTSRSSRASRSESRSRGHGSASPGSRRRRSASRSTSRADTAGISSLVSRTRSRETRSPSVHSGRSGSLARATTRDSFASSSTGFVGGSNLNGSSSRTSTLWAQPSSSSAGPSGGAGLVPRPPTSTMGTELDSVVLEMPGGSRAGSGAATPVDEPPSYDIVLEEERAEEAEAEAGAGTGAGAEEEEARGRHR
ncbi:hypothetical protein BCV69DRAFT_283737 [Microstroma glucosiphilum]|uniref:Uncharacterized protein n=1 Tax=Pseudomicrostroma glucosiphilum TaxID=1684307 RepID=A0A316U595_9BASI|nr:hypothetical protein BCV69DRAFT_283737 [Pseudomicrostroma glucosiphilum]PWN19621.1 hypothetical protein BCV69DRAFT_283737 [Pseudomicrostroma glucosiphilum]